MEKIIQVLKNSKNVAIIGHISPDPDCMGSLSALKYILNGFGKKVDLFDDYTKFKPIMSLFSLKEDFNLDLDPQKYDTIVTVDLPSLRQAGKYGPVIEAFNNTACIDHHKSRDLNGKCEYVDPTKSSCCEIIYDLAVLMGAKIDSCFCNYIFGGIIGDTNCFQNDNTNENTFRVARECVLNGANKNQIIFEIQKKKTMADINLLKMAYDKIITKNGIAYAIITKKMFKESGTDDCLDLVTDILNIDDNKMSFVIKQKDKQVYTVSLRCKEGYDVAKVADKFGGGGHVQAAGMSFVGAPVMHAKQIYKECLAQIKGNKNV